MFAYLRRLFGKTLEVEIPGVIPDSGSRAVSPVSVGYDACGVQLSGENGATQVLAWREIELIVIRIEEEFFPFPYWYVGNHDTLLRIPNDAVGGRALFFEGCSAHIDGYRSDATFARIAEAVTAMEGMFVIWEAGGVAA